MPDVLDPATGREVTLTEAFAFNGQYEVKATGYRATAPKNATTALNFAVGAEDRYINGLRLMLVNHNEADTIGFQVVDNDGVIPSPYRVAFPAYPILKTFGFTWNVDGEKSDQGRDTFNFVAKIAAGLYIQVVYTSVGTDTDVTVKLNCNLYKKVG
jgi:hypothetical protein